MSVKHPNKKFQATYRDCNRTITVNLAVMLYEEENVFYAFCPALDLYGYGTSEDEAKQSFEISLSEFIKYTLHKGTLNTVLTSLGWKIKSGKKEVYTPPTVKHLLSRNADYGKIMQSHSFKQVMQDIVIPAC